MRCRPSPYLVRSMLCSCVFDVTEKRFSPRISTSSIFSIAGSMRLRMKSVISSIRFSFTAQACASMSIESL